MRLYELVGADKKCRFSPAVWRINLAMAHKGLNYESVPVGFTEKEKFAASGSKTVPVLEVDGEWVIDSWNIACYLEDRVPDTPPLFGSGIGRGEAAFINKWVSHVLNRTLFPILVADIPQHLAAKDAAYFRQTREKFLDMDLEDTVPAREGNIEELGSILEPLRALLSEQSFVAGEAPAYADYIVFGSFQWARVVSPVRLLEAEDSIFEWRERMLDLFDGLARATNGYPI